MGLEIMFGVVRYKTLEVQVCLLNSLIPEDIDIIDALSVWTDSASLVQKRPMFK